MENTEIWLPVVGYEGLYEISDLGRVRSLNYHRTGRVQILKSIMKTKGYMVVLLYKDGKRKECKVHRLVAEAFLSNPKGLPEVNHRDEDKTNNAPFNLEWCDRAHNNNHGTRNARVAATLSKPVQQLTKDGVLVALWPSAREAERVTGIYHSAICSCCNGERHTAGGFIWKYTE